MNKILEPSILGFNKESLMEEIKEAKDIGINTIHFDIMDSYVNNTAFDIKHIQPILDMGLKINVHTMVWEPLKWLKSLSKFNIDSYTFQYEFIDEKSIFECLNFLKNQKFMGGIAIRPDSKFVDYSKFLDHCEIITIMTVIPGKGGQKFMNEGIQNLMDVFKYKQENNNNLKIEIDGGINLDNIPLIIDKVDYVVSGSNFANSNKVNKQKMIALVMKNI